MEIHAFPLMTRSPAAKPRCSIARSLIKSNTGRQRININGALDADIHAVITREDERINAQSSIALLEQVEAAYPSAAIIYVICDNARYYRSKLVGYYGLGVQASA